MLFLFIRSLKLFSLSLPLSPPHSFLPVTFHYSCYSVPSLSTCFPFLLYIAQSLSHISQYLLTLYFSLFSFTLTFFCLTLCICFRFLPPPPHLLPMSSSLSFIFSRPFLLCFLKSLTLALYLFSLFFFFTHFFLSHSLPHSLPFPHLSFSILSLIDLIYSHSLSLLLFLLFMSLSPLTAYIYPFLFPIAQSLSLSLKSVNTYSLYTTHSLSLSLTLFCLALSIFKFVF